MPQAGTFGINFNEIMAIATVATLLFAIIPPLTNSTGINLLEFPSAFVYSFNYLWFDDFNMFKPSNNQTIQGCRGMIESTGQLNRFAVVTSTNNVTNTTTGSLSGLDKLVYDTRMILGIWKTTPTVTNTPVRTAAEIIGSDNPVVAFMSFIGNLLGLVFGVIFSCGIGTIRLVIGIVIFVYWFLKLIPLWQLLWNMFMAFVG